MKIRARAVGFGVACLLIALSYNNCAKVTFDAADEKLASVAGAGTPNPLVPTPTPSPTGTPGPSPSPTVTPTPANEDTVETLKTMQPAMAVRGMACLVCHADIRSNIVTDFGYGSAFYLGGTNYEGRSWYGNYNMSWQTSVRIQGQMQSQPMVGQMIVPNVLASQAAQKIVSPNDSSLRLAKLVETPYAPSSSSKVEDGNMTPRALLERLTPPAGKPRTVEASRVVIRSPSATEILNIAPTLANETFGFVRADKNTAAVSLVKKDRYVMNDEAQTLECANGDLVVKGPLFLRNLKVNASAGCRLYVSGTVFIEGAVTYVGGVDQNLQITSATGIIMGMDSAGVKFRINPASDGGKGDVGLDMASTDFATLRSKIVADSNLVTGRVDAGTASRDEDASAKVRTINYTGLLLNAPMIHGRYLGSIKGTIVADVALFAVGRLHFEFDDVFTRVNVLPKLSSGILQAN